MREELRGSRRRSAPHEEFAKAIGADATAATRRSAVETAKSFMARKHNQLAAS